MINKKLILTIALITGCFAGTFLSAAEKPTPAQIIEKMPANTVAQDDALSAQLVATGDEGILDVCKMLVPDGIGNDTKARYALSTLTRHTARPGAGTEKRMYEKVLLKAISVTDDTNVKAFFVRQIQLIGSDESVETLAGMLSDAQLLDPAAQSLVTIASPAAETALLDAFKSATDVNAITLMKSLGDFQSKEAVEKILVYAEDKDQSVRLTALRALANIAPPAKKYLRTTKAARLLEEATHVDSLYERGETLGFYLLYAKRLGEKSQDSAALKICREVLRSRTAKDDNNAACKAISIIVDVEEADALADLLAAMDSENEYLHGEAVKLAAKIPGESATVKWASKLATVTPTAKTKIIDMLAIRGDRTAMPALVKSLKDTDATVRAAAIAAIAVLGDGDAVKPLLASLKTAQKAEIKTIQAALMTLPPDPLFAEAGASLKELPVPARKAVLEILADRNAKSQFDAVIEQTESKDESVRVAAVKALGKLAGADDLARLIDLMLNAESSRQRSEASRFVVRLCLQNNDVQGRAKPLLTAMGNASIEQKISIVKVLPAIGGKQAFAVVAKETKSESAKLSDAAIRSLAKSRDAGAMDALLEVAETTKETNYHVMTLKSYIGLVAGGKMSPRAKVDGFKKAMSIARRQDEKKYILARLSQIKSISALELAVQMIDDEAVAEDAAVTAVQIALPNDDLAGLSGPGVGGMLLELYPTIADADVRKRIDAYVRNMPKSVGGNLALKKPVTISCNAQSGHKPEYAVDGQSANKNTSYWGAKWPSWLQVDLQEVVPVGLVNLWFYWGDDRYYQYTVEVSTDGKKFTQVVDQSKNTTVATADGVTYQFNAVNARYVRVNILKNSDNEAVHLVELEVYAAGSGNAQALSDIVVPEGFRALFNGKDLSGWKGLLKGPYDNPIKRAKLDNEEYKKRQQQADELMRKHWHVVDGVLYFDGGGYSLATVRDYGDFEMLVDWKVMHDKGDSGIYLRGTPQVQIWDPKQHKTGSGGLYNNKKNPSKPTEIADNPIGQWNTFRIKMVGEKVTVYLNDKLVVDNVTLENYWDRNQPIFSREQIELQCHGNPICFKNIFIREIPFVSLFNGLDHTGWVGDVKGYPVENYALVCKKGGNILTEKEYSDFVLQFEFKLSAGANNGLGIRTPLKGNAAYAGMELQILDNTADKYKNLKEYQYHGSIYGVVRADPKKRGILKPLGQWNTQEVTAKGDQITVVLNGETIIDDVNIIEASTPKAKDGKAHPGLKNRSGHIGFLGHGDHVEFRNIKIKELPQS